MVNLPNDIYVICAYIGINVLLYLVRNIPGPRRATRSAPDAAQWCREHWPAHSGSFSKLWPGYNTV